MQLLISQYAQPTWQFAREAFTLRTMVALAVLFTMFSVMLVATRVTAAGIKCATGESRLVYPIYSKRGVVMDTVTKCGETHRGCRQRGSSGVYDCSPFMAPKGVL
jgi:hypothetical protein